MSEEKVVIIKSSIAARVKLAVPFESNGRTVDELWVNYGEEKELPATIDKDAYLAEQDKINKRVELTLWKRISTIGKKGEKQ